MNGFVLLKQRMISSCGSQYSRAPSEVVWRSDTGREDSHRGAILHFLFLNIQEEAEGVTDDERMNCDDPQGSFQP